LAARCRCFFSDAATSAAVIVGDAGCVDFLRALDACVATYKATHPDTDWLYLMKETARLGFEAGKCAEGSPLSCGLLLKDLGVGYYHLLATNCSLPVDYCFTTDCRAGECVWSSVTRLPTCLASRTTTSQCTKYCHDPAACLARGDCQCHDCDPASQAQKNACWCAVNSCEDAVFGDPALCATAGAPCSGCGGTPTPGYVWVDLSACPWQPPFPHCTADPATPNDVSCACWDCGEVPQ
jgi:hypothetical protein